MESLKAKVIHPLKLTDGELFVLQIDHFRRRSACSKIEDAIDRFSILRMI